MQISALKTCNKDISKHFIACTFKLGQLIEDVEIDYWMELKKELFF